MPLLMSRKSPESEASTSFRARSSGSSLHHRSERPSSQKAAELRARYEMAQAIQKPWPLHLLENGVKPAAASSSPPPSTSTAAATSSSRSTRSSSANKSSTRSSSPTRRETRSGAAAAVASTHVELAAMDADARSSKKKRNSANSLDKLSLTPTLSNWIKRASKDSDKSTSSTSSSGRSSSPPSSLATSPLSSPKVL